MKMRWVWTREGVADGSRESFAGRQNYVLFFETRVHWFPSMTVALTALGQTFRLAQSTDVPVTQGLIILVPGST